MHVAAPEQIDIQIDARVKSERAHELLYEFRVELPDLAGQFLFKIQIREAADVKRDERGDVLTILGLDPLERTRIARAFAAMAA